MKRFLISLLVICIIVGGSVFGYTYYKNTYIVKNPNTKLTILSTKTDVSDIEISDEFSINLSNIGVNITVYAKHDIRNLELRIDFCNSSSKVLASKYKYIGNIEKGESKTFVFSITDIPITKILSISHETISVSKGRTFYI